MKHAKLSLLLILILASCAVPRTTSASTPTLTLTFTPEPTATQTPLPTPTITPSPTQVGGGSGRLIFGLHKTQFAKTFPDLKGELNVFTANMDGTDLVPVTNGLSGYNYLESVSPDGTKALITTSPSEVSYQSGPTTQLYLIDLTAPESKPIKLGGGIYAKLEFSGGTGEFDGIKRSIAKWIDNARIVYIGQGDEGYGIYIVNIDGSNLKNIFSNSAGVTPSTILAIDQTRVYWGSPISDYWGNPALEVWWSNIDGTDQGKLESNGAQVKSGTIAFSPDGTMIAWVEQETRTFHYNYLNIASTSDMNNPKQLDMLTFFTSLSWSTDGSKVLVCDIGSIIDQSYYDTTSNLFGIYEVSIASNLSVKNVYSPNLGGVLSAFTELFNYSPDNRHVLISKDISGVKSLDLDTMTVSDVLSGITFFDLRYDGGAYWLP
jgi:hypothetical protein